MESLSKVMYPYKDRVGQVAGIVTIGQFLSGAFICKDIYKKGSTEGISAIPFVGGISLGALFYKYGLLLNDPATTTVNVVAILLNVLYIIFYYFYSEHRQEEIIKPLGIGLTLSAAILGYAEIEDPSLVEFRFGLITTILLMSLMASPLKDLKAIISNQDASSIPFPMTFMGTVVSSLWLLYGIILNNSFMVVQNIIGLAICLTQLIIIFTYPGKSQQRTVKKKKALKKD